MEIVRKSRELEQGDLIHKKEDDSRIYMIIYDDGSEYCWCFLDLKEAKIIDGYCDLKDISEKYSIYAKSNNLKLIVED